MGQMPAIGPAGDRMIWDQLQLLLDPDSADAMAKASRSAEGLRRRRILASGARLFRAVFRTFVPRSADNPFGVHLVEQGARTSCAPWQRSQKLPLHHLDARICDGTPLMWDSGCSMTTRPVYVNGVSRADWTLSSTYLAGYDDDATITFDDALAISDELRIEGWLSRRGPLTM